MNSRPAAPKGARTAAREAGGLPARTRRHAFGLIATTALAGAVMPWAHAASDDARSFEHKDWQLACDNTGTCRAAGYQTEGPSGVNPMSVLLTRLAGPATPVRGQVQTSGGNDEAAPAKLRMTVDGKRVGALIPVDAKTHTGELSADQVTAIVEAVLGRGHVLFLNSAQAEDVADTWALSGEGASAVLLKMDDLQGRLDTPSALVRKGARAEATVAPPVARPVIVAHAASAGRDADQALAQRILAGVELPEPCRGNERGEDVRAWRLDAHRLLVTQLCWRGAYNEADAFWIADDRPPHATTLVTAEASDFDAPSGTLTYEGKGRGMGDCFDSETWVWNGTDFVHATKASTGLCRDVAPGGPWNLPTVTSDVRPAR